jgi:tellurite resistance protein
MTPERRPMPAPMKMPKPGLWRRTPPAIFAPIMGLFGLGLGWRAATEQLGVPPFGDMILGATAALYAFAALAYLTKTFRRAATLAEDLRILPGRAGVGAASLCLMLLAAVLVPIAPAAAKTLATLAFMIHVGFVVILLKVLASLPPEGRMVTPVYHLNFVGFILLGLSVNPLGQPDIGLWLLWAMIPVACVIWAISLRQLATRIPPAPLRPLLAIHLAPASLFATVAHGAGQPTLALVFVGLGGAILLALLVSIRWLTQSGFSPLWGAFTFPVAAYAGALIHLSGGVGAMGIAGGVVLVAASLFIPVIAYRVMKSWASGDLAVKTNASEA